MSKTLVVCFLASLFIEVAYGADCVPGAARNVSLSDLGTLTWAAPAAPEPNCSVTNYLIFIENSDHRFVVDQTETNLNVSFLPPCEEFNFTIMSVSADYEGETTSLRGAHEITNPTLMAIDSLTANNDGDNIIFRWSVPNGLDKCVVYYRIVYSDESNPVPNIVNIQTNHFNLSSTTSCMNYTLEVNAVMTSQLEGPVATINTFSSGNNPSEPILRDIDEGTTTVQMSWQTDTIAANRCPITQLIVDCNPDFRQEFPVRDSASRPPIHVSLAGLRSSTVYICSVYVENRAGLSHPVHITLQTAYDPSESTSVRTASTSLTSRPTVSNATTVLPSTRHS